MERQKTERLFDELLDSEKENREHLGLIRRISNWNPRYRNFVRELMGRAKKDFIRLPEVSQTLFYMLLREALAKSERIEAIHQGSMRLLTASNLSQEGLNWFEALRSRPRDTVKRVIILENCEYEDELTDPQIMKGFWENTGDAVESYVAKKEQLQSVLGNLRSSPLQLFDCALYDGQLLLHHDRKANIASFYVEESTAYPKLEVVREIFDGLKKLEDAGVCVRIKRWDQFIPPPINPKNMVTA